MGTKVEIKNLNSIRFIKKAIEFEKERLIAMDQQGEIIVQQTRGFDEVTFSTHAIRTKEDEDDYRYFPEPDLPPFFLTEKWIETIRQQLPNSIQQIKNGLIKEFGLSQNDADQLAGEPGLVHFFIQICELTKNYKAAANWVMGPLKTSITPDAISFKVTPRSIAEIIQLIDEGKISYGIAAQKVLPQLINKPETHIIEYIKDNDLFLQSRTDETDEWVNTAINKYSAKIPEYKKGKKGLISLFVGEAMKLSKGRADAKLITEKIIEKLKNG